MVRPEVDCGIRKGGWCYLLFARTLPQGAAVILPESKIYRKRNPIWSV